MRPAPLCRRQQSASDEGAREWRMAGEFRLRRRFTTLRATRPVAMKFAEQRRLAKHAINASLDFEQQAQLNPRPACTPELARDADGNRDGNWAFGIRTKTLKNKWLDGALKCPHLHHPNRKKAAQAAFFLCCSSCEPEDQDCSGMMRISTRRFRLRPCSVLLSAIGKRLPKPTISKRSRCRPWPIR